MNVIRNERGILEIDERGPKGVTRKVYKMLNSNEIQVAYRMKRRGADRSSTCLRTIDANSKRGQIIKALLSQ